MRAFFSRIDHFFFASRSAVSFGVLRIVWAAGTFFTMFWKAPDIVRYFSYEGMVPPTMEAPFIRSDWRFTLLSTFHDPLSVWILYILLLLSCILMMIGLWPRLTTILSVLLLFTFHERNPLPLAGGDTVLRMLGFILLISPAPALRSLSIHRLRDQWKHWKEHRTFLPPLQMPAWPKRLLLWQLIVIYGMSVWSKFLGATWRNGVAIAVVIQNEHFSRFLQQTLFRRGLIILSPVLNYLTMAFELSWLLLLIPRPVLDRLRPTSKGRLRRFLILCGLAFHIGIQFVMAVGSFIWAMSAGLLGLLEQEDFTALRRRMNRRHQQKIAVLYDGHCRFCTRSIFHILLLDWLHRLEAIDFHVVADRHRIAPDLHYKDLNRELHIRFPDGRTCTAFRAFRALAWHLPLLWPLIPFLYIPGVAWIGKKVYHRISANRRTCTHKNCQY